MILFEIERESQGREIFRIIAPSCWLEIEEKLVSTLKFFFVSLAQRLSISWTRPLNGS